MTIGTPDLTWAYGIVRTKSDGQDIYVAAVVWLSGDKAVAWEEPGMFAASSAVEVRQAAKAIVRDLDRSAFVFDGDDIPSEYWGTHGA
jgi:hypothetical protein